jgi:hypothetical protein
MGQLVRTVCDRHNVMLDEIVETPIPTLRIILTGALKEHRLDIEGEFCADCIAELLAALSPWAEAGRRPGRDNVILPPGRVGRPPASPVTPDNDPAEPAPVRRRPGGLTKFEMEIEPGTLDDYGQPILNAGPFKCGAPGAEDCKRHTIGFSTKQAVLAHERGSHRYSRTQSDVPPTIDDPSAEELAAITASTSSAA